MSPIEMERLERAARLETIFKPSTPINSLELFSGRQSQSRQLLAAVNQQGRHALLFGERGVGKTSLANILFYLVDCPGYPKLVPRVGCVSSDTYGSLWSRVFNELGRAMAALAEKGDTFVLPKDVRRYLRLASESFHEAITIDAVKAVLSAIGERAALVVVIDEFDVLGDSPIRRDIADTIKYLSDRSAPCTIVLIGVADNVEALIEDHRSIERCLAQVKMPPMSRDELEDIVTKHLARASMTAESPAQHEISRISCGLPHYAHLLGLYSGLTAIEHDEHKVTGKDVGDCLPSAVENSHHTVKTAYVRATESSQKTAKYKEVLTACAMTRTNELGWFSPSDVREPLSLVLRTPARIEAFARHLHTFCEDGGGPVLRRMVLKNRPMFKFINPLMPPFALMKALADGLVTEDDLRATRDPGDPQLRLF